MLLWHLFPLEGAFDRLVAVQSQLLVDPQKMWVAQPLLAVSSSLCRLPTRNGCPARRFQQGEPTETIAKQQSSDSDAPVIQAKYWSDVLDTATISNVLKDFYCVSEGVTLSEFLKLDKENVYSVWPEGKVPLEEIIIIHNLTQDHLAPLDWDRYTEYQKSLEQDMSSESSPRRDLGKDMEQASS